MLVHAESLDVIFPGPVEALRGVNLDVPQGQFVSIVGPSGCGKSTLLRAIAGLLTPSAGTLTVADQPPTRARRSGVRMSIVFQDPTLLPWRCVADNVRLPLELRRTSGGRHAQQVRSGLAMVGLEQFAASYPAQLSGGMRMRASLARSLVTEPDLLLLDEPFGALDDISRQTLNEELLDLWAEHHWTGIFVTHNISEAVFLSQRVLVMSARPGRVLADIAIGFAMPRRPELRTEPVFAHFAGEISAILRRNGR